MRLGLESEATLAAALIDAAADGGRALQDDIEDLLESAIHSEEVDRRAKWLEVAGTRVIFDEM